MIRLCKAEVSGSIPSAPCGFAVGRGADGQVGRDRRTGAPRPDRQDRPLSGCVAGRASHRRLRPPCSTPLLKRSPAAASSARARWSAREGLVTFHHVVEQQGGRSEPAPSVAAHGHHRLACSRPAALCPTLRQWIGVSGTGSRELLTVIPLWLEGSCAIPVDSSGTPAIWLLVRVAFSFEVA